VSRRAQAGATGGLIVAVVLTYATVGLMLFGLGYAIGRIFL
jgi:hypothetical protein